MFISKRILFYIPLAIMSAGTVFASCSADDTPTSVPVTPSGIPATYARGADVSWLTQMEAEGEKFRTPAGEEMECMRLLRDHCGVNAIRLRVWVNPMDGWNGIADVMAKARRASGLGMRLMIDFHFSDTWADPGHQQTPAAWASLDLEGLKEAAAAHVTDMLSRLKAEGITPEWVQIGNETTPGMMHPLGSSAENPAGFTALVNAGHDAAKAIFPDTKVVVHLDQGQDEWRYDHIFGILATHGGRYDMIGMSLYPEPSGWQSMARDCVDNIKRLHTLYGKPVVICETGMNYREADKANSMISYLMDATAPLGYVDGIFYWEPQAPAGYNGGYDKGCFVDGVPTKALDAFRR